MALTKTEETTTILDDFFVGVYNRILVLEEKWLKAQNLDATIAEAHMLVAIAQRENGTMGEVSEAVSLTNGTVTTMVKKLEAKNLVERTRDSEDKRILRVRLTEKGRAIYDCHENFHKELTHAVLLDISDEEKTVLLNMMKKINAFFTNLR